MFKKLKINYFWSWPLLLLVVIFWSYFSQTLVAMENYKGDVVFKSFDISPEWWEMRNSLVTSNIFCPWERKKKKKKHLIFNSIISKIFYWTPAVCRSFKTWWMYVLPLGCVIKIHQKYTSVFWEYTQAGTSVISGNTTLRIVRKYSFVNGAIAIPEY